MESLVDDKKILWIRDAISTCSTTYLLKKLNSEPKSDIPSDPPNHFLTRVNSDGEDDDRRMKKPDRDDRDDKPRERRERKDDSGRRIKGVFFT